jgi:chromosomal replication initiation ATPase DnaA
MGKERAHLNFDDDLDLSEFQPVTKEVKNKPDQKLIEQVAEQAGFPSRDPNKKQRRRRKPSPYIDQINIRCRAGMKDIFQDLGEYLDVRDHTTFEKAIKALIEKEGLADLKNKYEKVTQ